MITLKTKVEEAYAKKPNWESIYLEVENWKKDLEFYYFDINFLEVLIENYFSKLLVCINLDEFRELQIELYELKSQCEYLLKDVQINLESIVCIINKTYVHNASAFKIENKQLGDNILRFINYEIKIKKDVFSMIKNVIENQNLKRFG